VNRFQLFHGWGAKPLCCGQQVTFDHLKFQQIIQDCVFIFKKLFMHFCSFVNIMFGLRFLCVTCESYFESQKVNSLFLCHSISSLVFVDKICCKSFVYKHYVTWLCFVLTMCFQHSLGIWTSMGPRYPKMTHSQVTGWNPLKGFTKSSCGKLILGGTLPASNSRKG